MKAAQYKEYGGPEVIELAEADKPTPVNDQVLVEVKASAINPFDYKVRDGIFKNHMPLQMPVTISSDFAGVIAEDGGSFKAGDEVYGSAFDGQEGSGAAAEFAAATDHHVALKPSNVTFTEAAALVLVGSSAVQALDKLNLKPGSKILIHGGAGGIGSVAIQYAKHLGAYVATTVQAKDKDFVKSLGADEIIDYENEKFEDKVKDYDAVFDTVGGPTFTRSFTVIKPEGKVISMNYMPGSDEAKGHEDQAISQNTHVESNTLDKLRGLVESGVIKPKIDKVFPLEQTAEAFKYLETGHPQGKVVVKIG